MIRTLKNLKNVLEKIDDEHLDVFGIGHNMENDCEICVVTDDEHYNLFEKYKTEIKEIQQYIDAILKAQKRVDDVDDELDDVDDYIKTE